MNAPMPVTAAGLLNYREDFPILARPIRGQRLSYLDNGATTQKPRSVIEAEARFYEQSNANIHRGVHWLSQHATELYDQARSTVRAFLNAARDEEIVFTRGTTESINLVAYSWGMDNLKAGDEILLTGLEHHSNIVPWQLVAQRTGAIIRVVPVLDNGELDQEAFKQLLNEKTRLLAVGHVSNALGTINPIADMTRQAHAVGAKVLVDGAQSVPHGVVDVQALDADFYTFSAHKLYGPTGMGALYVRYEILDSMSPWMGGGDMITTVSFEQSNYAPVPQRFEAGTPNIAGAITMAAAMDYLMDIGMQRIADHEALLLDYATDALLAMPGIRIVGTAAHKAGIVSFLVDGIHPHDLGTILDMDGVAVRAGHHCAMPLMTRFGIPGTARASFALYNDYADIDALLASLRKAQKLFGVG
ncbi:cysteine desulfurase [Alcaligenes aquatilis]|jgi:cysteine desulfurase/selenocysteine lyase|uniref:cysteine desulfurase n=1 Tax=Alcaligenes aquatilis TaxID=323284 RepID=A0ABY4NN67_9BURK|nr:MULTISPECIES: cysteine desulfurase [Alcaligenes]UQN37642.1 cysteine desulfurase [Alcaligenes aquatilis]HBQ88042.1 cysteine desulfurase CsdA [Alcaligenes faecalis]